MKHIYLPLIFLLTLLMAFSGCSDDPATPPGDDPTVGQGELVPAGPDFAIELEFAAGPDSLVRGPFLLRGKNLFYSDLLGALIVDITLTNNGQVAHPEPVSIDFFRLIPETTHLLVEPDEDGRYLFEFANDDAMWTPGEESLPRQLMFSAPIGQSVGFNFAIHLGEEPGSSIAGRVWHDVNGDGIIQPDEPGLPRIPLVLDDGGPREILRQVYSGADGRFRFPGLESGTWEVRVLKAPDGMIPTTPSSLHVLLAQPVGDGGGFDQADFGFVEGRPRD